MFRKKGTPHIKSRKLERRTTEDAQSPVTRNVSGTCEETWKAPVGAQSELCEPH